MNTRAPDGANNQPLHCIMVQKVPYDKFKSGPCKTNWLGTSLYVIGEEINKSERKDREDGGEGGEF